jgi:beta-N-acetylhexosaminidase
VAEPGHSDVVTAIARRPRPRVAAAAAAAGLALLAGCGASRSVAAPGPAAAPRSAAAPTPSPSATPAPSRAHATTPAPTTSAARCPPAGVDLAGWPLSRRIAQLIAVPSLGLDAAALAPVLQLGVGGVLILGSALPPDLAAQIRAAGGLAAGGLAPIVMADEEGGGVQRLLPLVSDLPWPRDMAQTMSVDQVAAEAEAVALQMRALGVTMDLAPVLDVDGGVGPNDRDPDGSRSFSAEPSVAARYGIAFMRGILAGGVVPVVKHFPGLGQAGANTDLAPAATLPLAAERVIGLPPFAAAIAAGAPAVMISNATVPGLTDLPSSLSAAVIDGLLRGQLGFRGLVLTDSLSAGAVSDAGYSVPVAAARAIAAGADLVLFGSTLTPALTAQLAPAAVAATVGSIISEVTALVAAHDLTIATIDAAVAQVLRVKGRTVCGPA